MPLSHVFSMHDTLAPMKKPVAIVGAGLAGSEAALQLARRGIAVTLHEMRPVRETAVHKTANCAELVCSNSLKSMKPETAAGMLKRELDELGSAVFAIARRHAVAAGGALAVNREEFAREVTETIEAEPLITLVRGEVASIGQLADDASAIVLATGPLTSEALADDLATLVGNYLAFYDAAAPIVMADSLDTTSWWRPTVSSDVISRRKTYSKHASPSRKSPVRAAMPRGSAR